jgi:hypothetical protein
MLTSKLNDLARTAKMSGLAKNNVRKLARIMQ